MIFKLEFKCDTDAFKYDPATEISIILETASTEVLIGNKSGLIMDRNGNTIGTWEVEE